MTTFSIDTDNNITAFTAAEQVPEGQDRFATEKEFAKLSADWPITRFGEVWNAFAGVPPFGDLKPVKKFTDRKSAVARIWKAIQGLDGAAPETARWRSSSTRTLARRSSWCATSGGGRPISRCCGSSGQADAPRPSR